MRRSSVLAAVAIGGAVALAGGAARAQGAPRTMRLEVVRAADTCPDAEAFREAVDIAGGFDPFDATARARLVVTITASGPLARGRWEIFDEHGTKVRERSASVVSSCKQLVGELALAFVVAYETPPADAPAPCPPPVCDDECRAKVREEVRRELVAEYRRPMDGVAVAIMAGGLLSAGFTADPGGGGFFGAEVHGDIFSGALEARFVLPSRAVLEPSKHAFQISQLALALVPCARWKVLLGCAAFDIGMLVASSITTAPTAGPPVVATLGIGPRLAVHVPFAERFGFRAFADLRFSPLISSYVAQDTGARWESGIVSGLFGLGFTFE